MKLLFLVLLVCAAVAAAPKVNKFDLTSFSATNEVESRNILVNALVRQVIAYVRRIINEGSDLWGIPPLDPLNLDQFHLYLPAGLINLDLSLRNVHATGFGGFIMDRSHLDLRTLTFDLDVSVPSISASADEYDLIGDLFGAIPLYGKGNARFYVEGFQFQAKLFLKQSDDGNSVLIDRIENARFVVPTLKSQLTGAIGGGDIDAIVNAMIEEVIIDYVNRFQGAISIIASNIVKAALNPVLEQLDTWRFIAPLLPRI